MANSVVDEVTPRAPLRTAVSRMALVAVGLGGLGAALFAIDLATRPPCAPGYVRLVDLEPVGPIIGAVLAGLALVLYVRSRRGSHLKIMLAVGVVLLLCVAYVDLSAVALLVQHHGAQYDSCWTF